MHETHSTAHTNYEMQKIVALSVLHDAYCLILAPRCTVAQCIVTSLVITCGFVLIIDAFTLITDTLTLITYEYTKKKLNLALSIMKIRWSKI